MQEVILLGGSPLFRRNITMMKRSEKLQYWVADMERKLARLKQELTAAKMTEEAEEVRRCVKDATDASGRWSPLEINALLHHYALVGPYPHPSRAYDNALESFRVEKLMYSDTLKLTPRGLALVKMFCATPLPDASFTDPRTGERIAS